MSIILLNTSETGSFVLVNNTSSGNLIFSIEPLSEYLLLAESGNTLVAENNNNLEIQH
jgi:hypothetical protein